jgi:hypothetical protein
MAGRLSQSLTKQPLEGHGFSFSDRTVAGHKQHQIFRDHLSPCDVFKRLVVVKKRNVETAALDEFIKVSCHRFDEMHRDVREALRQHPKQRQRQSTDEVIE